MTAFSTFHESTTPPHHRRASALLIDGITYTRHPLSALFGNLSDEDYALLKSSIEQVGQQRPILLAAGDDYRVLDGWNRLRALSELGLSPVTRRAEAGTDEVQLVTAVNLAQRTLSAGQRALIAARLASYTHGGRREGRFHEKTSSINSEMGALSHNADDCTEPEIDTPPHDKARVNPQELNLAFDSAREEGAPIATPSQDAAAPISIADAANRLCVSRAYVVRARTVAEKAAPQVLDAVQRGTLSLNEAAEVVTKPVETQLEYIARRIKEGTAAHRQMAREAAPRQRAFRKHVEKHARPPADATPDEIDGYVLGLLVGTRTHLNRVANWIEDGLTSPGKDEFEQFFGAVNRLRGIWEGASKAP